MNEDNNFLKKLNEHNNNNNNNDNDNDNDNNNNNNNNNSFFLYSALSIKIKARHNVLYILPPVIGFSNQSCNNEYYIHHWKFLGLWLDNCVSCD